MYCKKSNHWNSTNDLYLDQQNTLQTFLLINYKENKLVTNGTSGTNGIVSNISLIFLKSQKECPIFLVA